MNLRDGIRTSFSFYLETEPGAAYELYQSGILLHLTYLTLTLRDHIKWTPAVVDQLKVRYTNNEIV